MLKYSSLPKDNVVDFYKGCSERPALKKAMLKGGLINLGWNHGNLSCLPRDIVIVISCFLFLSENIDVRRTNLVSYLLDGIRLYSPKQKELQNKDAIVRIGSEIPTCSFFGLSEKNLNGRNAVNVVSNFIIELEEKCAPPSQAIHAG